MNSSAYRVLVAHRPPLVFIDTTQTSQSLRYYGMLIESLPLLLQTAGLPLDYVIYDVPNIGGGSLVNGTWTGVVGALVARQADIVLFPLTLTIERMSIIGYTLPFLDEGYTVLVPQVYPTVGAASFLVSFSTTLWILILSTIVAVAVIFNFLHFLHRAGPITLCGDDDNTLDNPKDGDKTEEEGSFLLTSCLAATNQGSVPGARSWGIQALYIVYCLFCLIILSTYTANLTAYLTVSRSTTQYTGLSDLARSDALFAVTANGSVQQYFTNSADVVAKTMAHNMVPVSTTDEGVAAVRSGEVVAYISDAPVLDYYATAQPCDIVTVGNPFGPGQLVIGLQHGSPLQDALSQAIVTLKSNGYWSTLQRRWYEDLSQCTDGAATLDISTLDIAQLAGIFYFLAAGAVFAIFLGILQKVITRVHRKFPSLATMPRSMTLATIARTKTMMPRRISILGPSSVSPSLHDMEQGGQQVSLEGREAGSRGSAGSHLSSQYPPTVRVTRGCRFQETQHFESTSQRGSPREP